LVGVWCAGEAETFFVAKDPGYVVIDEVVGQIVTLLLRPDAAWKWLLTGFVVFRVLDVIKPFPARQAERLPGGWGIMTDDLAAGLYGMVALSLLGFAVK
jgi:phosphatidylglycerophosphatase A